MGILNTELKRWEKQEFHWDREKLATELLKRMLSDLRKLQPAASDLEELLWEAELKGLHYGHSLLPCENLRDKPKYYCCNVGKRITELEKARATSEGL